MAIIGDAAHAPSPTSGQGASLACEDAVILAKCLRDLPTPQRHLPSTSSCAASGSSASSRKRHASAAEKRRAFSAASCATRCCRRLQFMVTDKSQGGSTNTTSTGMLRLSSRRWALIDTRLKIHRPARHFRPAPRREPGRPESTLQQPEASLCSRAADCDSDAASCCPQAAIRVGAQQCLGERGHGRRSAVVRPSKSRRVQRASPSDPRGRAHRPEP